MDFEFGDEEKAVAELARQILEDHATNERQKELEAGNAACDEALWQALAEANLLGTAIPAEHGGSDLGFMSLCLLLQEVGRTVARIPAFPALALAALPIAEFGNDEQKEAWLPGVASGERILTAALGEFETTNPLSLHDAGTGCRRRPSPLMGQDECALRTTGHPHPGAGPARRSGHRTLLRPAVGRWRDPHGPDDVGWPPPCTAGAVGCPGSAPTLDWTRSVTVPRHCVGSSSEQ